MQEAEAAHGGGPSAQELSENGPGLTSGRCTRALVRFTYL
jgi:hypothetical protein